MKYFKLFFTIFMVIFFATTCKKRSENVIDQNNFGKIFSSKGSQILNGIIRTPDNNYILYGTTNGSGHGNNDGFIMKIDTKFNLLWYNNYGGGNDDQFNSLALDDEGNMLAVGSSNSFGASIDTIQYFSNSLFYLVYINSEGQQLWDTTFQANPGKSNIANTSNKVLFTKEKNFFVCGSTSNFLAPGLTAQIHSARGYAFGVSKVKKILWQGRFYKSPPASTTSSPEEVITNATILEDGNILMEMTSHIWDNPYHFLNFLKIPSTGATQPANGFLWYSSEIHCLGTKGVNTPITKSFAKGLVYYDILQRSLIFTADTAISIKAINLEGISPIVEISNNDNQLILTAGGENGNPGWVICDVNGMILEEIKCKLNTKTEQVNFIKVFLNNNDEVHAFGILKRKNTLDIITLRFDRKGNILR